jgi:alpha-beta hydrolase superfamily lysophospholipase
MKRLEEDLDLDGHALRRFIFCPDDSRGIRAVAMHFHGQGDFAERYGEILEPFTRHGIACVATDLPGHGRSEGARGRVPGFEIVDRIAESNRKRCRELCGEDQGPLGILGHSAGGLMALRELLLRPEPYSFSWISSPLLRPETNQHPLLLRFAPLAARLVPGLTVGTGVTPDQCTQEPDQFRVDHEEDPDLFHARVSFGWGYALIEAARRVRAALCSSPPTIPLLITQGLADPVCPPQYLHEVLDHATIPQLRLREFADALHEPFADAQSDEVLAVITAWLEEEGLPEGDLA